VAFRRMLVHIGVGDRGQGGQLPSPKLGRKNLSGKHRVIFGQLIYFWKKEQAPFIFWQ